MTTALCFNDFTFSPITHQSSLWIRAAELARALGYASEKSIANIFKRHESEFSNDMSTVINLMTTGITEVPTRIFSLRGCHLIAMFARTPVAKQFRRWVLDVLDNLAKEETVLPASEVKPLTPSTADDRAPLRALVHAWANISGVHHASLWPQVKAHFQLSRIDDLPRDWLSDALNFVQGKIDGNHAQAALPPSTVPALRKVGRGNNRKQSRVEMLLRELLLESNGLDAGLRRYEEWFDKLATVTGPLHREAMEAMTRTDDNVMQDSYLSTVNYHRWYVRESLQDARHTAAEACRSAMVVTRLWGA